MRTCRRITFVLLAALATVCLWPVRAVACTCISRPNPACQAFFKSPAVFVGEVEALLPGTRTLSLGTRTTEVPERRVTFRVVESFSGPTTPEIVVATGMSDADCGFPFQVGSTYLVYTYGPTGGMLSTGICSPTRLLGTAVDDVSFLRSMRTMTDTKARVYGRATDWDGPARTSSSRLNERPPYEGARIRLSGDAGVFTSRTGSDGTYELLVPPGKYAVTIEAPDGKYGIADALLPIDLPDPRACAAVDIGIRNDSHVGGRIVDSGGHAVPGLTVELEPVTSVGARSFFPSYTARTDENGRFEIVRVPTGQYAIGFNTRTSQPYSSVLFGRSKTDDTMKVIDLGAGDRADAGALVVPERVQLRTIRGRVVDGEHQPIEGARVYLEAADRTLILVGAAAETPADGTFTFSMQAGFGYQLKAELSLGEGPSRRLLSSEVVPVADDATGRIELIVRR